MRTAATSLAGALLVAVVAIPTVAAASNPSHSTTRPTTSQSTGPMKADGQGRATAPGLSPQQMMTGTTEVMRTPQMQKMNQQMMNQQMGGSMMNGQVMGGRTNNGPSSPPAS